MYRLQENSSSIPFIANHDRFKQAYSRKQIDTFWVQKLSQPKQKTLPAVEAEKYLEDNCGLTCGAPPNPNSLKRPQRAKKTPHWYGDRLPDE